jgi:hypothetical protein
MGGAIPPLPHSGQEQFYVLPKLSSACAKVITLSGFPVLSLAGHYMAAARNETGFEFRFKSRVSSLFLI